MRTEPSQRAHSADPLHQIAQCHQKIAAHLRQLETLAVTSENASAETCAALAAIVRWFETNGARHAVDEDESLFPRLAAQAEGDPALAEALRRLGGEHDQERALVAELARAVRVLEQQPGGGMVLLRAAVARFVGHFRSHVDVEDQVVLPAAARDLAAPALAAIAAEMDARRAAGGCS